MKNLYEELETMCLRCECRGDLKCGTTFHCKTYNNLHDCKDDWYCASGERRQKGGKE